MEAPQKKCVYIFEFAYSIKIGVSGHLPQRMETVENQCGFPILRYAFSTFMDSDKAYDIEKKMHTIFADVRKEGEFFGVIFYKACQELKKFVQITIHTNRYDAYVATGYPFNRKILGETITPQELIEFLFQLESEAKAVDKKVKDFYTRFFLEMLETPYKNEIDKVEHSARILEMVSYQLAKDAQTARKIVLQNEVNENYR